MMRIKKQKMFTMDLQSLLNENMEQAYERGIGIRR